MNKTVKTILQILGYIIAKGLGIHQRISSLLYNCNLNYCVTLLFRGMLRISGY